MFVAWKGSTVNLVAGVNAGSSLTSGNHDTFLGIDSGKSCTTGNDNTGNGYRTLYSNISGIQNTASGSLALFSNTSNYNTADGYATLFNNTTGSQNCGVGTNALFNNVGGHYNTAAGMNSLFYNVNGSKNVGVGHSAGKYETGNNAFYVDNQDRTDTAGDKAKALLYGTFDADPVNQTLKVNGSFIVNGKRLGVIEDIDDHFDSVGNGTYPLRAKARVAVNVDKVALYCSLTSGTVTVAAKIDGVSVDGCNAISVTDTLSDTTCTDNATNNLAVGSRLELVTSLVSSCGTLIANVQTTTQ